jgi:hypothetical protein
MKYDKAIVNYESYLDRSIHSGSEVLTAVIMINSIVWDTPPCSPLKNYQRCNDHGASIIMAEE